MRHPAEFLRIATQHNAALNLFQHRHGGRYLTLGLLPWHLQHNLHLPGPWHAHHRAPEIIQAVEVGWACKGFFKELYLEHTIQAKHTQILPQMAIADRIPESGVEDQAVGINGSLSLLCLTGAVAHPDTLFLLRRCAQGEHHRAVW